MSETTREFAGCGNGFCENCDFYPQCRFAPNLKCDESDESEATKRRINELRRYNSRIGMGR